MSEPTEREEIARLFDQHDNWSDIVDRIIAERIEPIRAELQRVCDLGERRTRERDQAMTAREALEALLAECETVIEPIAWRGAQFAALLVKLKARTS